MNYNSAFLRGDDLVQILRELDADAKNGSEIAKALLVQDELKKAQAVGNDSLSKALTAGTDVTAFGSGAVTNPTGAALKIESLSDLFVLALMEQKHLAFYQSLKKVPETNNVTHINTQTDRGPGLNGGWLDETGLPAARDFTLARRAVTMGIRGVRGTVGLIASNIATAPGIGSVQSKLLQENIMLLSQEIERGCFFSRAVEAPGLASDGLLAQMESQAPGNIIDFRNRGFTIENINDSLLQAYRLYAEDLNELWLPPALRSDMVKAHFGALRGPLGEGVALTLGISVKEIALPLGSTLQLYNSHFLGYSGQRGSNTDYFRAPLAAVGDATLRPPTPVFVSIASPAAGASQFVAGTGDHDAGDYNYWVVAFNPYGASAPLAVATHTVAAGDGVDITWAAGAGPAATHYKVYRARRGVSTLADAWEIATVAGTSVTFQDLNAVLPGTYYCFGLDRSMGRIDYAHLGPEMMNIPLGRISVAEQHAQVHIGTLRVNDPFRQIVFKNVERTPGFLGDR